MAELRHLTIDGKSFDLERRRCELWHLLQEIEAAAGMLREKLLQELESLERG